MRSSMLETIISAIATQMEIQSPDGAAPRLASSAHTIRITGITARPAPRGVGTEWLERSLG